MLPVKLMKAVLTLPLFVAALTAKAEQVSHTYDDQNRLIRTEYGDGSGIEYTYDAAGNRVGQKALNGLMALVVEKSGTGSGTVKGVGIDCGSDCTEGYAKGTPVTLSATPASGSNFAGWGDACSGTGVCQVTMDTTKRVTATFTLGPPPTPYLLKITKPSTGVVSSVPDGILCGGRNKACQGVFATVTLSAAPNPGYYLKNWAGCPGASETTCNLTLTRKTTVKAVFAKLPLYTLKISKTKGGGGIHIEPGGKKCKDTQTACSFKFPKGTNLILKANPASGRSFMGWGDACSGTQVCALTMDVPKRVTAAFQ